MIKEKIKKIFALLLALFFLFNTFSLCTNNTDVTPVVDSNVLSQENIVNAVTDSTDNVEIKPIDQYLFGENIVIDYWIDGNVFVIANSVTVKGQIGGDLFVVAKELNIQNNETSENSNYTGAVYGNIFALVNTFNLNGQVYDVYTCCENFNLDYYGFVYRDIHVASTKKTYINGIIKKNAFISTSSFETTKDCIIGNNLDLTCDYAKLFGSFGNSSATENEISLTKITSKDIEISNEIIEETDAFKCSVYGNLEYSSKNEIAISDGIVSGNVTYNKYTEKSNINFISLAIEFISLLLFVLFFWLIINKFTPKLKDSFLEIISKRNLKALLFGFISVVSIALVAIILTVLVIGISISSFLFSLLGILLIISIPLAIIAISELLDSIVLFHKKFNSIIWILITTLVTFVLMQITYLGLVVELLLALLGIGIIVLNFCKNKTEKE